MYRTDPIEFGLKTYVPPKEIKSRVDTKFGPFSIIEGPIKVKISFTHPGIIYTDEFASRVSYLVVKDKKVEIDCGPCSLKSEIIAEELMKEQLLKKIEKADGQKINVRLDLKKLKTGLLGLFGKRHVFVTYTKQNEKAQKEENPFENYTVSIQGLKHNSNPFAFWNDAEREEEYTFHEGYIDKLPEDEVDDFFSPAGGSKYLTAPKVEIFGSVLDYIYEIDHAFNKEGIVQIERSDFFGLGIFLENGEYENEVIINLNGQNELYFGDVFCDLVTHYLKQGKIILVDYDLEDIYSLENKVLENETYDLIHNKTGATVSFAKRETNTTYIEEHAYVILEPP